MLKRYYCISDGYTEVIRTDSLAELMESIKAHIYVLMSSPKENSYTIYSVDMTEKDFEIDEKNRTLLSRRRKGNHLRLV